MSPFQIPMAVAELFIGAFITLLFEKLASRDLIRLARSTGIHSELKKWSDSLTQIQVALVDAGEKHIQDKHVELWLNKLQHLAYEIDDVLDDLFTKATLQQLNKISHTSTSKVIIKFIPNKLHTVKYNHKMSSKLDEITTRLLDLVNEKRFLDLSDGVKPSVRASRGLETTSLVDRSEIIGMEGDKEALLSKLLGDESSSSQAQKNFNVVSIVGMGGIGKTTLARLVYNDLRVKDHFELMSWVCVSHEFDVFTINKTIYKDVGRDDRKIETLNQLQVALSKKLSRKRFLLVLDDVWSENFDNWETLQRPFTVVAPGSKILVTTRKAKVASMMDSVKAYPLEVFSDEEALSLFAQHASSRQDYQVNRTLKLYGEDIIKKCGRLPLALTAIGRVFRTKSSVEEWEELLNRDIWNSHNDYTILSALKLSYYDLPPYLKQMFVYCCLFPKDYMFNKDELVLLWMAEGFLYESNGNNSMESLGHECIEELLSRSFFQRITGDDSHYTMHVLINDLATSVAGEFFLRLDDKMDVSSRIEVLEKFHHLSFITVGGADHRFKALKEAKRLRTYLAINLNSYRDTSAESMNVVIELLSQLKFLRVLSLINYNITKVPELVCSLSHLRYLNFSNTEIACLPEQVGDLLNLQTLLVSNCHKLSSLPNSLVKLISLRHLDITHTSNFNKISLGMFDWTSLRNLTKIVIGKDDVFHLSDLKGLLHLHGKLSIKGLHKVINELQAKEANLQEMKGICNLHLEWSDEFDDSRNKATEYEVLEGLKPFKKLKSLEIFYYGGTKFPNWVVDASFVCLTKLTVLGCRGCKRLPALGHLPSLRELFIEGMDVLERLDFEFLGRFNLYQTVAFPSLEVLKFKNLKSLEEWSTSGGAIDGAFPCLHELSMIGCGKLDVVPIELMSSLQVLHVIKCSLKKLQVFRCNSLVSLGEKEVQSVTEVLIEFCEGLESYNCPSSIKKLQIRYCNSLTSLNFPTMDELPSNLKYLDIRSCLNLKVSWIANNFLSSLEHLCMWDLQDLRLFPEGCLVHLTNLEINDCDNIEFIPDHGYGFLPSRCLKRLEIRQCKNLKSFPFKDLQSLASLKEMTIRDCPSLSDSFPCGLWPPNLSALYIGGLKKPISEWGIQNFPTSLVTLYLYSSEELVLFAKAEESDTTRTSTSNSTSSFLLLPSSLTELAIYDFKKLESVSEGMQHLTSLQHLQIWGCPKVRDLPETLLPPLSSLTLADVSPELIKKCSREGEYWPIISQIANRNIYNELQRVLLRSPPTIH